MLVRRYQSLLPYPSQKSAGDQVSEINFADWSTVYLVAPSSKGVAAHGSFLETGHLRATSDNLPLINMKYSTQFYQIDVDSILRYNKTR